MTQEKLRKLVPEAMVVELHPEVECVVVFNSLECGDDERLRIGSRLNEAGVKVVCAYIPAEAGIATIFKVK